MKASRSAGIGLMLAVLAGCGAKQQAPAAPIPPAGTTLPPQIPTASARPSTAPPIAARNPSGDRVPLAQRMVEFHDRGELLQAIGAANRVIKNGGPSVAKAYYIRGSAEGQINEVALAVQDLKTATQKDPENAMAWFSRAWYEYEMGDLDRAISTGEKAVSLDPRSSMAWLNLGLCYAVKNNGSKAKRCYDSGRKLANRGVLAEAMRDIDNATQRYPKSEKTLNQAMKWLTGE